jgi:hypothetical protein
VTKDRFEQILKARLEDLWLTNTTKSKQYAPGQDRMVHFKGVAEFDGITPEKALWDMAKKHMYAMKLLCLAIENGEPLPPAEVRNEIYRDNAFYPILLEGLIREREDLPAGTAGRIG